MRVRSYLIILISIVALGAFALVGGLTVAYQNLEKEREQQAQSSKAFNDLSFVKDELSRLTTIGDLVFGAAQGLNSYLAKPTMSQVNQVENRLKQINTKLKLDDAQLKEIFSSLKALRELFDEIHKGQVSGDEYDRYDELSFQVVSTFRGLFKTAQSDASKSLKNLEEQRAWLKQLAWYLSSFYLLLIISLTWWSNRSISKPVARLSNSASVSLDEGDSFPLTTSGPTELKALGAVLYRLINQLGDEVQRKTIDLEQENKERRAAEAQLRILNERQRALVEASVRFVPRPFLEFLGHSDLTLVERGDSIRRHLGILFSDLRGFTSLAENREAQEIFDLLNRYLDAVVPPIHEYEGFVDKYIGDAIMALFPTQATHAVQAGVEMFHKLYEFVERDQIPLSMGVGIHWGEVILGTLGSDERWESTVIGDTVNLAARLEGMTKAYASPLIISDSLKEALPEDHPFTLRALDLVRVKGRNAPVTIYEVIDAHPLDIQESRRASLQLSEDAFQAYRDGRFEASREGFSRVLRLSPEDRVPKLFIERCDQLLREPLDAEWSGVYTHTSK